MPLSQPLTHRTIIKAYLVGLHCILLHLAVTVFLHKLKVGGDPAASKSISPILPTAGAHFTFLDNSLHISNFSIIITCVTVICNQWPLAYDYLRSVISDLWHRSCSGHPEPCPPKMGSFIHECYVCPDCTTGHHSPISVPLFRPLYSLRHNWN